MTKEKHLPIGLILVLKVGLNNYLFLKLCQFSVMETFERMDSLRNVMMLSYALNLKELAL